jgi:hypothetical protein
MDELEDKVMKRICVAWLGLMAFAGASATAADLPR